MSFPAHLGSFHLVYLWLALHARTGDLGPDVAAVKLTDLRWNMQRSMRWLRTALEWLAAAGYVYSVPAPPEVVASGISRVFVLRLPDDPSILKPVRLCPGREAGRGLPDEAPWKGRRRAPAGDAGGGPGPMPDPAPPQDLSAAVPLADQLGAESSAAEPSVDPVVDEPAGSEAGRTAAQGVPNPVEYYPYDSLDWVPVQAVLGKLLVLPSRAIASDELFKTVYERVGSRNGVQDYANADRFAEECLAERFATPVPVVQMRCRLPVDPDIPATREVLTIERAADASPRRSLITYLAGSVAASAPLESETEPEPYDYPRASHQSEVDVDAIDGFEPRWTGQIRPFVDTANPAISGIPRRHVSSTSWVRVCARI